MNTVKCTYWVTLFFLTLKFQYIQLVLLGELWEIKIFSFFFSINKCTIFNVYRCNFSFNLVGVTVISHVCDGGFQFFRIVTHFSHKTKYIVTITMPTGMGQGFLSNSEGRYNIFTGVVGGDNAVQIRPRWYYQLYYIGSGSSKYEV